MRLNLGPGNEAVTRNIRVAGSGWNRSYASGCSGLFQVSSGFKLKFKPELHRDRDRDPDSESRLGIMAPPGLRAEALMVT